MKELSLNILDIAENSVSAGAARVAVTVEEQGGWRTLTVEDDGRGMEQEFLARVTDPFTTTRTTRSVGMGLPLLKLAAEQAGGTLTVESRHESEHPDDHGTAVKATFLTGHVDCEPLGDLAETIVTLLQGHADLNWRFVHRTPQGEKCVDTDEMRAMLGGEIPLSDPEVLAWVRGYWDEPFEGAAK